MLERMYRDIQEPVLNAMGGPNPFQVKSFVCFDLTLDLFRLTQVLLDYFYL